MQSFALGIDDSYSIAVPLAKNSRCFPGYPFLGETTGLSATAGTWMLAEPE